MTEIKISVHQVDFNIVQLSKGNFWPMEYTETLKKSCHESVINYWYGVVEEGGGREFFRRKIGAWNTFFDKRKGAAACFWENDKELTTFFSSDRVFSRSKILQNPAGVPYDFGRSLIQTNVSDNWNTYRIHSHGDRRICYRENCGIRNQDQTAIRRMINKISLVMILWTNLGTEKQSYSTVVHRFCKNFSLRAKDVKNFNFSNFVRSWAFWDLPR